MLHAAEYWFQQGLVALSVPAHLRVLVCQAKYAMSRKCSVCADPCQLQRQTCIHELWHMRFVIHTRLSNTPAAGLHMPHMASFARGWWL